MKPVDVDSDSSELSVSTTSNTTLPHLEAIDAERALNDNERRRKEARKLKREAREKKKEEQWLEDMKQRERKKAQARSKKKKKRS